MARPLTTLLAAIAIGAIGATGVAGADQLTLTLDPARTTVSFTLGATLHTVHGSAPVTRGVTVFDPAGGEASGEIVVDASRANTGNTKRDKDMHESVLVSARYPTVVLRPTRVEGRLPEAGTATFTVHGTIELLGSRHEIAAPVEVTVNGATVAVRAEFELPYVAWGLEDPSKFLLKVDRFVTVAVAGAGTLSAGPGSAGATAPSAQDQPQP
jgi:polyisoprenoid-binding protein YceI